MPDAASALTPKALQRALEGYADWPAVAFRLALLVMFSVVSAWLATRAFRVYQRSI